jgi:hypothetical protein
MARHLLMAAKRSVPMTYKKKVSVLLGIIGALTLIYIASIVFDPERIGSRSAVYAWLDAVQNDRISGIIITNPSINDQSPSDRTNSVNLTRRGDQWFVSHNGRDYPARQTRVADLIAALNKRTQYPVRTTNASSHERLSLLDDTATHIAVLAGAGQPLMSLLIGMDDLTGRNIYLRKQGDNEVRSGEDIFSAFTNLSRTAWYNLRLFPESESGNLIAENVQRLTVYPPEDEDIYAQPRTFTRSDRAWSFNFELADPDTERVNSYIRDILNSFGDEFIDDISTSDPLFNTGRLVLEFGDGSVKTLRVGPADEIGRRYAVVTGSDKVYLIPGWVSRQLFVDAVEFERN